MLEDTANLWQHLQIEEIKGRCHGQIVTAASCEVGHEAGGGVSLLYYHGNIATPTKCTNGTAIGKVSSGGEVCGVTASTSTAPYGAVGNTDFDFTDATAFQNDFDRIGFYASYPIAKK